MSRAATARAARFEVLDLLGRGGMGDVFRAWDHELEVEVALKALRPAAGRDPRVLARFKRELKLARRVKHVNVAQAYDLVSQDGRLFIAMEFVDGKSLSEIVKARGSLPVHVALGLLRQACSGVQAAHDEGVIHRDLKPHNVMIRRRSGRACILDFGIAGETGVGDEGETGVILGSPQYMSYEQLAGLPVTPRSDVYQLAIVLFEMITGVSPFRVPGASTATLRALREIPPDPRSVDSRIPKFVSAAIVRALDRDPAKRPQTPMELCATLADQPEEAAPEEALRLEWDSGEVEIASAPTALVAMPEGRDRDQVADRLARLGCTVTITSDGMSAVDETFVRRFSLVILAAALPRLDGLTACQVLQRNPACAGTRMLVVLAAGDADREAFARQVGASDVVRTPLNVHAFARTVRELLK